MNENIRLDHLVYATNDVQRTSARLGEALGVMPGVGGQHIGRGTRNTLLSFGASFGGRAYLEIIGPDPDQPEPAGPRPFGVDDLTGERLVAWAVATSSMEATLASARAGGFDPGDAQAMQRKTPSGDLLSWRLTTPLLVDGLALLPFVIDWGSGSEVGPLHPSITAPSGVQLTSFSASHPEHNSTNSILRALTNILAVHEGPLPALSAVLSGPAGSVSLSSYVC